MSSQFDHGKCPICFEQISIKGEHQIASLPCGHVFGCSCIKKWLETSNACPVCQKHTSARMIRMILWDGSIPIDKSRTDSIRNDNEKAKKKHQFLIQKLARLERDYAISQSDISVKRRMVFGKTTVQTIKVSKQVAFPSLILNKKINNGFRVCLSPKHLYVTSQKDKDNFGIEFCERDSLSYFNYIPLHKAQIHEMALCPFDSQTIATVSHDKRLIITVIRSQLPILQSSLPVPLWSCAWINHNVIATGGTNGRLFIVDGRGQIAQDIELCKGPPIFSIAPFSDNILFVSSPMKSILFDMRMQEVIKNKAFAGSHSVKICENKFISMTRRGNIPYVTLGTKTEQNNISIDESFSIQKYNSIAKPDIIKVNKDIILAIPDESSLGFKLISSKNFKYDYWEEWKDHFSDNNFSSPINDISMEKDTDLILAAISSDSLKMYAFPL